MISPFWWMSVSVGPAVYFYIYKLTSGDDPQHLATLIGIATLGIYSSIIYSCGWDIEREKLQKTLVYLFMGQYSFFLILIIKAFLNQKMALISFLIVFLLALSNPIEIPNNISKFNSFFLVCFFFITNIFFSVLIAICSTLSKNARSYVGLFYFYILIFGGFLIDIKLIPSFLRWLSYVFPIYHINQNLQLLLRQQKINLVTCLVMTLLMINFSLIAYYCFKKMILTHRYEVI